MTEHQHTGTCRCVKTTGQPMPEGEAVLWTARYGVLRPQHCEHFLDAVEEGVSHEEHQIAAVVAIECGGKTYGWEAPVTERVKADVHAEIKARAEEDARRATEPRWEVHVASPGDLRNHPVAWSPEAWAGDPIDYRSWHAAHETYCDLVKVVGPDRVRIVPVKQEG